MESYEATRRPLTADTMQWNPVGRNYAKQMKVILGKKKENGPDEPGISKLGSALKWIQPFRIHLSRIPGERNVMFNYVSCNE